MDRRDDLAHDAFHIGRSDPAVRADPRVEVRAPNKDFPSNPEVRQRVLGIGEMVAQSARTDGAVAGEVLQHQVLARRSSSGWCHGVGVGGRAAIRARIASTAP
jgi:hypothetical protein